MKLKKYFSLLFLTIFSTVTIFSSHGWAILSDSDRQENPFKNLLGDKNPGFENGVALWTVVTDTISKATSSTNFMGIGRANLTWDSAGAGRTLTSPAVTISNGYASNNGLMSCKVMTPSGTATHTMGVWDGSTLTNTVTIPSSTIAQYVEIPFQFGAAATTVAIRFTSVNANEPLLAIDDCFIGRNYNISQVTPSRFIGSANFAVTGSCSWSRTNTAFGAFSTTAACPGPTIEYNPGPGVIQTTDTDLPKLTLNNAPAGEYTLYTTLTSSAGAANVNAFTINDGTTSNGNGTGNQVSGVRVGVTIVSHFTYTTPGNRTWEVYGAASSSSVGITNQSTGDLLRIEIHYDPTTSQTALRTDNSNFDPKAFTPSTIGSQGFGTIAAESCNYARDGKWMLINCKITAGTVAASEARITLPDSQTIDATLVPALRLCEGYWVRASTSATTNKRGTIICNGGNAYLNFSNDDYTGTVSPLVAQNGNTIFSNSDVIAFYARVPITLYSQNQKVPLLVGSVTSNTTGLERVERVRLTGGTATSNCTSSPCTIFSQSGAWVSSITRTSTGIYPINFAAGIFSANPSCTCVANNGAQTIFCTATAATTSLTTINIYDQSSTVRDAYVDVICMGPR